MMKDLQTALIAAFLIPFLFALALNTAPILSKWWLHWWYGIDLDGHDDRR